MEMGFVLCYSALVRSKMSGIGHNFFFRAFLKSKWTQDGHFLSKSAVSGAF
jgi:hypothetical protein